MKRLAEKADANIAEAEPDGRFKHFDHHHLIVQGCNAAKPRPPRLPTDFHRVVEASLNVALEKEQGTFDRSRGPLR